MPSPKNRSEEASSLSEDQLDFPVVAVGASAGGIEALKVLLNALPPNPPAAFVVVTHSPPRDRSDLGGVLANFTSMPVVEAKNGLRLSPGVVHTIPANRDITLRDGILKTVPRISGTLHLPFDRFLASLAEDQGTGAVCVVLSGTGADGSQGLRSVSQAGGMVLVQDPATAQYPGMPGSAAATGLADAVLPLEEIGPYLGRLLGSPNLAASERDLRQSPGYDKLVSDILSLLRHHSGHDLSGYKRGTVDRRIHKRLLLSEEPNLKAYAERLKRSPEERTALFKDLLIGVTGFFRDPEAFEVLRREALPSLFGDNIPEEGLRVWVACCSTGEEAYSVAMLLDEYLARTGQRRPFTIFASDIQPDAVAHARRGVYSPRILDELSQERLAAYFACDAKGCAVAPRLRERIVFARHDLLNDPPFLRMDLVVCRNFLIYLTPDLQKRAMATLAHSLRTGGFLMLGPAETIGNLGHLLDPVDRKWRLFRCKKASTPHVDLYNGYARRLDMGLGFQAPGAAGSRQSPATMAEKALARMYAPPAALLDANLDVVHLSGDISPYLQLAPGEPSHNIFRLAKKALKPHLRSLIQAAQTSGRQSRVENVAIGGMRGSLVNLVADHIPDDAGAPFHLLVAFETAGQADPPLPDCQVVETPEHGELIARYETELTRAHDQLQRAVESYEALNEELKASNEELISMNEELQSSNEEMDASREELQSLNEELQGKVGELAEANVFVENLLRSTNLATLFLSHDGRIMRFTPAAQSLFNLIGSDVGRPIGQITNTIEDWHFTTDIDRVLAGEETVEREVRTEDGRWFQKRVNPYQAPGGEVAGVVMTFSEVTQLKQAEQVLLRGKEELELLVGERTREIRSWAKFPEENPNPVMRVDKNLVITLANPASASFLRAKGARIGGRFPLEYAGHISRVFANREEQAFEVFVDDRILAIRAAFIADEGYVNVYGMDITERKRLEEAREKDLLEMERQRDFLESLISTAPIVVGVVEGAEHRYVQANPAYEAAVPVSRRPVVGKTLREVFPEVAGEVEMLFDSIYRTGQTVHLREYEVPFEDRTTWWDADYVPVFAPGGAVSSILVIGHEISELVAARKRAEEEALKWRAVLDNLVEGLVLVKADGDILSINPTALSIFGFDGGGLVAGNFRDFPDIFELRDLDDRAVPVPDWPIARALRGETFSGYELRMSRKDTGESWVIRHNGAPVLDKDGNFLFSFVCLEDVTERRQVRLELERTRRYIDDIINSMPSKVVCVDSRGVVTHYNKAAADWLALPPEKALGEPLESVFPPLAAHREDVARAVRDKVDVLIENEARREGGELRYRDVLIYPLEAEGLDGAVLRVDDVTERVRISELMVQTEKMMSVGGMAAGMAHEINNPLASILQSAQVVLMQLRPDRTTNRKAAAECSCSLDAMASYLEKRQTLALLEGIREAGLRAARIVSSMLEFSRKSESRRELVLVTDILEKSLALASSDYDLNKKFDFRHVDIVREYEPGLPPVSCVRTEIEQVVFNLLTNAAHAMVGGKDSGKAPTIVLRARALPDMIRLEIEDNGPGMEEGVRKRVFEPFFTTKEPGTGTGLGLSVSYFIIVSKHDGNIRVESTPGKGTLFIIELPLK